jgi:CBS domain-containing protein
MHKGATCVEPDTPVREIAKHMRDSDVGAIPVKANGQFGGNSHRSRRRLPRARRQRDLPKMTAKDVMTKNVVCCSPDNDVRVVIQTMEAKQIRRLPVTDSHETMVGMLSLGDISQKLGKQLSGELLRAVSGHHA